MSPSSAIHRVFDPIDRCLTVSFAKKIVNLRTDPELNARLEELAEKANEGELSTEERAEYEAYVRGIDLVSILQSKARQFLTRAGRKR